MRALFLSISVIFSSLLFIASGWTVVTEPARSFSRAVFQEIVNQVYPDLSVSLGLDEIGWDLQKKEINQNRGISITGFKVKEEKANVRKEMGPYPPEGVKPWEFVSIPSGTRQKLWQILSQESDDYWKNIEKSVAPSPPDVEPYYSLFDKYGKEYDKRPYLYFPADKEEQMKCKYRLSLVYIRGLTPEEILQDPSHRQLKEEEGKRNKMVSVRRRYAVQIYFNSIRELPPKIREAVIELEKLYRQSAGKPLIAEITKEMLAPPSPPSPPSPPTSTSSSDSKPK